MGLISNVRKILAQDFKDEDRALVSRLSEILNSFMTETVQTINGNIDFANLNQELVTFNVTVDGSGNVTSGNQVKLSLLLGVTGTNCISARNLDDSSVYPTGTPFLSGSAATGIYKINNISNLQTGAKYELTVIFYYR